MKIEKINENQIRCTLTRDDLAAHQLKLSELAYGTEKAKSLFHDMMQQASREFGFEANDIPLMIEAMPGAADSIILIITKVDNPEDIDSKFSKLGSATLGDPDKKNSMTERLKKLEGTEDSFLPLRFFSFATLDGAIKASSLLKGIYHGMNTLYKDEVADIYLLALTQSEHSTSDFSRICNMLSEYGCAEPGDSATLAFLEEHCSVILPQNAMQSLGEL